jgi:hypothetical protein
MGILPERANDGAKISAMRIASLFCLFFLIAFGLGYPVLNRYDPRLTPALTDVRGYAALVTGTAIPDEEFLRFRRFRVLVPAVAKPFYEMAKGRCGSWDPVMFGLLAADSLFVAGTALLIVVLGTRKLGNYAVAVVASLLYLLNFAVPNLALTGLVDAGEGFFLLVLLWNLSECQLWALPLIGVLGTLTKESFVPLSIAWTAAWWFANRNDLARRARYGIWILISWTASFAAVISLQWWITGRFASPIDFAATLHGDHEYAHHFSSALRDRSLWYIFLWLLPLSIPNLKRFPKSWLIPVGAAAAMAIALDAYHGVEGGGVGRPLFSVAGPLLALSSALLLTGSTGSIEAILATDSE